MKKTKKESKKLSSITPNIDYWKERYIKGEITNDELSRMTPSFRKHLERYAKKVGK